MLIESNAARSVDPMILSGPLPLAVLLGEGVEARDANGVLGLLSSYSSAVVIVTVETDTHVAVEFCDDVEAADSASDSALGRKQRPMPVPLWEATAVSEVAEEAGRLGDAGRVSACLRR